MGIFSLFKKDGKTGRDSVINSTELIDETPEESFESSEVFTSLSISPEWDVSKEQEYALKFLSNDLPPLKPNQLSLSGIGIEKETNTGNWQVQAFLRSSLNRPVMLGKVELILFDTDQNPLASQEFDLSLLSPLPPLSNRPWVFTFDKKNIYRNEPTALDWTLAFNVQSLVPHSLDLDTSWEQALTVEQKENLQNIVERLPALKPQIVNVVGFQIEFTDKEELAVSIFIRNGYTQHVKLDQILLEVFDAQGHLVTKGGFKMDDFIVKANTSKPWTFVFPKQLLKNEAPDLSKWTARFAK